MPAFEVEQRSDHDGVRLVARPALPVSALAAGVVVLAICGFAVGLGLALAWLVPVLVVGVFLLLPVLLLWVGQRRVALELSTRQLQVGVHRVAVEDLEAVEEIGGTVRIHTRGGAFEVGHDWPAEWRSWLVERLREAMAQRSRQLAHSGPEQAPPAALQQLRQRE
jgi:hypothetical protein